MSMGGGGGREALCRFLKDYTAGGRCIQGEGVCFSISGSEARQLFRVDSAHVNTHTHVGGPNREEETEGEMHFSWSPHLTCILSPPPILEGGGYPSTSVRYLLGTLSFFLFLTVSVLLYSSPYLELLEVV